MAPPRLPRPPPRRRRLARRRERGPHRADADGTPAEHITWFEVFFAGFVVDKVFRGPLQLQAETTLLISPEGIPSLTLPFPRALM